MSYRFEKDTGDLVIEGFETGISPSPHKGVANIQNANISTELGEVMNSFTRVQQTSTTTATTGSLAFVDSTHVSLSITGSNNRFKGMWITVTATTHNGELANGTYYVLPSVGSNFQLSSTYNGSAVSGFTTGLTASFTIAATMATPVASCTETYSDGTTIQYRYYMLDTNGLVWVYDTGNESTYSTTTDGVSWFLPDTTTKVGATGLVILNGWLLLFTTQKILAKPTIWLGIGNPGWVTVSKSSGASGGDSPMRIDVPHFAYVGHQGRCYYTDGNYIGSIFPDTSLVTTTAPNVQSYAQWTTSSSTTGIVNTLISGSLPVAYASDGTILRIPVVFFSPNGGTIPSALTADTIYYIQYNDTSSKTFSVYAAATGGSAKTINDGSGTQYFNTFYPTSAFTAGLGSDSYTFTNQRLNLPTFETATCMTEIGNTIIIGCRGSTLYPWNQIDVLPSTIISLPENHTFNLVTVNQVAYAFVGRRGNVYLTDGSLASLAIKIPDYCAGIPGTPFSYIEPIYTWGGAAYIRGRIYFSVLDQTSSKAGNCGGIWSFIPTQNFYLGQDVGLALRLENMNSYGTYNGVAPVIIPAQSQNAISPQYWSAWYSNLTSVKYGIDFSGTGTGGGDAAVTTIETDLIPTGTFLNKKTDAQLEYKLSSPIPNGSQTVAAYYRVNATDAYITMGTVNEEGTTPLSGYWTVPYQNTQWIQFKITLSPNGYPDTTFMRLKELRLR